MSSEEANLIGAAKGFYRARIKSHWVVRIVNKSNWRFCCPLLPHQSFDNESFSIYYGEPACHEKIRETLSRFLTQLNRHHHELVALCIGTDRSTGDCLGPLVGTRLKQIGCADIHVYGTLDEPVHAINLGEVLELIRHKHRHSLTIAVDACLGKADRIGYINVKAGALYPGTAVKKSLPPVGDVHVSGIVNVGGFMEHLVLQNTRLGLVYKMADIIARGMSGL